jgi:serine/alanine adding enzyme
MAKRRIWSTAALQPGKGRMTTTRARTAVRLVHPGPDAERAWQRVVESLGDASLAHSAEWLTVIRKAYGHDPLYLSAEDDEGRAGVLPAFIVRRPLFGTVVTSMPFLDTGGPCSGSAALTALLVERLITEAQRLGARTVELRCTERLDLPPEPDQHKVTMALPLTPDSDQLWRQVGGAVRNQIRKAERAGLSVDFGGVENLAAFYDAFAARMRDLGSPVHAFGFLRAVMESFGARARIALVRKGNTAVGGLLALTFKDRLVVPWATCLKEYFSLCPNMLLYWETLRFAGAEGFRCFDFGRSSRDSSTYRFKSQWGAREEPLFWYTIPVTPRRVTSPTRSRTGAVLLTGMWRHLPVAATRRLGPPIRKYLTQ